MIASMRSLPAGVDMAEIRLDCLEGDYPHVRNALRKICEARSKPLIITNRPVREGGFWEGSEVCRLLLLKEAAEAGADYIDIELGSIAGISPVDLPCRKIISYHDFEKTPGNLEIIYRQCRYSGADVVKIATMAADISDSARMLDFLRSHSAPPPHVIALCMGEEGVPTRVLAPAFGGIISFASQDDDGASAPGQITCRDMLQMYRFKQINAETGLYGVVANPAAHSMSPAIHNAAFAHDKLNAVYLPFKVKDPESFMDSFVELGIRGLSVTIPHKESMIALMDDLDEPARRVGALNTIKLEAGRRLGYNTDVAAALGALCAAMERTRPAGLTGCRVLLIGAGGAGRALAYGLCGRVQELIIANRTESRAAAIAAGAGARSCGLPEIKGMRPDIIINTTSVGMHPHVDATPVPPSVLAHRPIVMDAVYNPAETRLLREAREAGCVTVSGFDWFVEQAARQYGIWTGARAPREIMAEAVLCRLN